MRTQTLAFRFEDEVRLARVVDPTGWLAPAPAGEPDTDTPGRPVRSRRAGRRPVRRSSRLTLRRRDLRRRAAVGTRPLTRLLPGGSAADLAGEPSQASGQVPHGYRLDRWARLSLTVTVLATAVIVIVALTSGSASPHMVDVTVVPGDTLWSIASTSAPDRDPRAVIHEIQELNKISGDVLPVGVVLRVPASTQ